MRWRFRAASMNAITIKPLDDTQLAPAVSLLEAQLREHSIASSPDALAAVLSTLSAQPERGFLLTACYNDAPVGVAYAACILSLEYGGSSGWLEEFYVLPEWRGQGVGSSLLAAVIAAATERGWPALDIEVDSAHQRVLSLYARSGFQPVSRTRFALRLLDGPVA